MQQCCIQHWWKVSPIIKEGGSSVWETHSSSMLQPGLQHQQWRGCVAVKPIGPEQLPEEGVELRLGGATGCGVPVDGGKRRQFQIFVTPLGIGGKGGGLQNKHDNKASVRRKRCQQWRYQMGGGLMLTHGFWCRAWIKAERGGIKLSGVQHWQSHV